MKPGRPAWTAKAPPAVIAQAEELVDAARLSAREIHARLNLTQYGRLRSFERWATERRRRTAEGRETVTVKDGPATPPAPGELLAATLVSLHTAVQTGDVPAYKLPDVVRAMATLESLRLDAAADRRASELHELKLAELRKAQAAEVEKLGQTGRLTPDQVAEIRLKVLGL